VLPRTQLGIHHSCYILLVRLNETSKDGIWWPLVPNLAVFVDVAFHMFLAIIGDEGKPL
jgi:hypothetical protein